MFVKKDLNMKKWILPVFAIGMIFMAACSDDSKDTAGTSEESEGLYAVENLDVAGLAQKGPFVKGSAVTVQGIDCKTMKFTEEEFKGKVKSNKGDFGIDSVNLSASCALFTVSGYYMNEVTGKKSSEKLTLHAITDLSKRKSVNINVLTELEYERVMMLVSKNKMSFANAKLLAEEEVLASLGVLNLFESFEGLNIYEKGDGNATLLATSVLLQSDLDAKKLADRMDDFASSIAETGEWNDEKTKTEMANWAAAAEADGTFEDIRKNIEKWGDNDESPEFEKVIEKFGADSTMTDSRDGKVYRTIKIGNQVWMAENLNFKIDSSYCYNDSSKYCKKYGRLYSWAAAKRACPEGWHLPTIDEFETLFAAVGGQSTAGKKLKSASGWKKDGNGTDDYSFTALPAGGRSTNESFYGGDGGAYFWSSTEYGKNRSYYIFLNYQDDEANEVDYYRDDGMSVRCVKGKSAASSSSSSAKSSSSSVDADGWNWDVPKEARLNPKIKYDTMIDPRDKQVYKVVKIDVPDTNYSQVWMAENLNYADSVKTPSLKGSNWCYNDDEKNCEVSGRYYTWAAAIDSVALANDPKEPLDCGYGKTCGLDHGVQGICPDGWHLPTLREWSLLCEAIGDYRTCGEPLKALTGWNYAGTPNNNGTDLYGFASLPTGRKISATSWQKVGSDVYYWSATEYSADQGRYFNINNIYTQTYTYQNSKYYGQSVRCVKGEPVAASSSSSAKIDSTGWSWDVPKGTHLNPNIEYDSIVDSRDNHVYKVVKIEVEEKSYSQVWMAENLNYADSATTPSLIGRNWCYNDDEKNCEVGGRYYTWAAAIDSVALAADTVNPMTCGYGEECELDSIVIRGICPEGWHLPSIHEWGLLSVAMGPAAVAGEPLKALTGWNYAGTPNNNGTDLYGFAALPTGRKISATSWQKVGSDVYYWSSTEEDADDGRYFNINNLYTNSYTYQNMKTYGQSVRCVKD